MRFTSTLASAMLLLSVLGGASTASAQTAFFREPPARIEVHGRLYCFAPDGWAGPGWYLCGFEHRRGLGFGGPPGWHGFGGRGFGRPHPGGFGVPHRHPGPHLPIFPHRPHGGHGPRPGHHPHRGPGGHPGGHPHHGGHHPHRRR